MSGEAHARKVEAGRTALSHHRTTKEILDAAEHLDAARCKLSHSIQILKLATESDPPEALRVGFSLLAHTADLRRQAAKHLLDFEGLFRTVGLSKDQWEALARLKGCATDEREPCPADLETIDECCNQLLDAVAEYYFDETVLLDMVTRERYVDVIEELRQRLAAAGALD